MSKILQLCPVQREYHAVFFVPKNREDPKSKDGLCYIDVPMFALVETGSGKTTVWPMIVMRDGSISHPRDIESGGDNFIGCTKAGVASDKIWLSLYREQKKALDKEKAESARSKAKRVGRTEPVPPTDDEEEEEETEEEEEEEEEGGESVDESEEEEDQDDDEPQGHVHLGGKKS